MLKRRDSPYVAGRRAGLWYKWKRDPLTADCVLMYAQRGSGKRSSLLQRLHLRLLDRRTGELLPVGKAYFGFTDEELKWLDRFVRNHTVNRFGPVREVEKSLVLEVAFEFDPREQAATSRAWPCASRGSAASAPTSRPHEADPSTNFAGDGDLELGFSSTTNSRSSRLGQAEARVLRREGPPLAGLRR